MQRVTQMDVTALIQWRRASLRIGTTATLASCCHTEAYDTPVTWNRALNNR